MYDKLNYFDQYGGSLVLFIVMTMVVFLTISYLHTLINIQPIINDWPNQRCKPSIIPFAGLITHPDGVTASEYTYQNFTYCTQNILSRIVGFALEPLTFVTNSLQNMAKDIQTSIQSIRAVFDKVRTSMQSVSEEIMGRLMNVTVPLMQIIISFKDLIGKIQGSMTAGLMTLLGSYYTLKSLMGAIAQFIVGILIALSVMVAAFWAVPFTWGAAIANTSIFVALSIPFAIILAFMHNVLKVNTSYKIPKLKCFDKNTLLQINDGSMKKIIDIEVGDVLSGNNTVTGKIKVATEGSTMYLLNDVLVSDTHIVKYGYSWIPVSKHPDAVLYKNYEEENLYCLNTTQKIIKINNMIFTDWDELYDEKLERVLDNDKIMLFNQNFIHKYLDCGFTGSTKVSLCNNEHTSMDKVKINDVLENGEKVYGIVEIDGSTIVKQYKYNLGKNKFIEGYSLLFDKEIEKYVINNNKKLYHLLTDKGTFKVENTIIKDYNAAIDSFLENSK
jgi:hypothetical protein